MENIEKYIVKMQGDKVLMVVVVTSFLIANTAEKHRCLGLSDLVEVANQVRRQRGGEEEDRGRRS